MCTEKKSGPAASFSLERVNEALEGTVFAGRLHHFTTIDSTQTRALADAAAGADAGQVYIADEQTAGRGRGGHAWHSEPERGLYLTVLVRPALRSNEVLKLSVAAALAAHAALLEAAGVAIDLRWPNDLVYRTHPAGRSLKLGGILTESASTPGGELRHAAIGLGLNLNQADFPQELQQTATSVRLACGCAVDRVTVAIVLLRHLDRELHLLQTRDAEDVFERFSRVSSWVRGKRVHVAESDGYTGVTAGLTADGLLQVLDDAGERHIVRHGGVREADTSA